MDNEHKNESIHPTSIIGMAHQREAINQQIKISHQEQVQKLQDRINQLEKENQTLKQEYQSAQEKKRARQRMAIRIILWISTALMAGFLMVTGTRTLYFYPLRERQLSLLDQKIAAATQELKEKREGLQDQGRLLFIADLDDVLRQKLEQVSDEDRSSFNSHREKLQKELALLQKTPKKILSQLTEPNVVQLKKQAIILELQQLMVGSSEPRLLEIKQELVKYLKAKNPQPSLLDEEDIALLVRQFSLQVQKQALEVAMDKSLKDMPSAQEIKNNFAKQQQHITQLESQFKALREERKKLQSTAKRI